MNQKDSKCPICLSRLSRFGPHRATNLKCGHIYGKRCIYEWLKASPTCALCRRTANPIDVRLGRIRHSATPKDAAQFFDPNSNNNIIGFGIDGRGNVVGWCMKVFVWDVLNKTCISTFRAVKTEYAKTQRYDEIPYYYGGGELIAAVRHISDWHYTTDLINIYTAETHVSLNRHHDKPEVIFSNPQDGYVATFCSVMIKVWDVSSGACLHGFNCAKDSPQIAFGNNKRLYVYSKKNYKFRIYNLLTSSLQELRLDRCDSAYEFMPMNGGMFLCGDTHMMCVKSWCGTEVPLLHVVHLSEPESASTNLCDWLAIKTIVDVFEGIAVNAIAFNGNDRMAIALCCDSILIWEISSGKLLKRVENKVEISRIMFYGDERLACIGKWEEDTERWGIRIWKY